MIKYTRRTIPERHLFAVLLQHLADKGVVDIEEFYKDLDVHIEEVNKELEGKSLLDLVFEATKKTNK